MSSKPTNQPPPECDRSYATVLHALSQGEEVSEDACCDILAMGKAAVPILIRILEAPEFRPEGSVGDGWAPIHAAKLLGGLSAADAIEPMLRVLEATTALEMVHCQVTAILQAIGAPVLEPALAIYARTTDRQYRRNLCDVLSSLGVHDDRIFDALLSLLHDDPERGAMCLAEYNDPRAIPHLSEALERQRVDRAGGFLSNQVFIELRHAIEELGGSLTQEQKDKCNRANRASDELRRTLWGLAEAKKRAAKRKTGRNAPCWCGSGKKYKKCHWADDHRVEQKTESR